MEERELASERIVKYEEMCGRNVRKKCAEEM